MKDTKLSRDAWIAAGFLSLAHHGPSSLQIKSLAEKLGTTKGSFYWHFKDLKEFKSAMQSLWRSKVASKGFEDVSNYETAEEKLEAFFMNAVRQAPEEYGGRNIEPAMRAWALSDREVAAALDEVDALRLLFISKLLKDLGMVSRSLTELIYGAYLGLDDLHSKGQADIGSALNELKTLILASRKK